MLMLKVNEGESVYLDDLKIQVKFAGRRGAAIVLGFDAPAGVDIVREAKLTPEQKKKVERGDADGKKRY